MLDKNITWLRALACLMVVCIHVCGYWYNVPNSPVRLISLIGMGLSRPSVPVFAMISGYLIFREDKASSLAFASKRFFSVLAAIFYFGTLFYFYDILTQQADYPYWEILFAVKRHVPLWYLFALLPAYSISAYISLPLGKGRPFYRGMFALIFIIFFLTQSIFGVPFYTITDYSFDPILLYMILGFVLGQHTTERPLMNYLSYIGISAAIIYLEWSSPERTEIYHGYGTILVFAQSIFFFRWIKSLNIGVSQNRWLDAALSFIAKHSLGIFGWHFLFVAAAKVFWDSFLISPLLQLALSYFSVLSLSLLIAMGDKALWAYVRRLISPLSDKGVAWLRKYAAPHIH